MKYNERESDTVGGKTVEKKQEANTVTLSISGNVVLGLGKCNNTKAVKDREGISLATHCLSPALRKSVYEN